ncbi:hypothetical protein HYG87_10795 [Methanobacterium alkalithermotolerans]|uniref:Uncharacterized protein n=1 Tax=Methanobacterium alkalithermotolerans TaxID=2731220 RepID=A0A8T8K8G4_9EURY|nr:hypothetical protein [Methanobacterium alkalithermotolerans]QUH24209.1 hypothetical protein HYG87_10795 [Methanobacterium alkalithermotolerans]
MKLDYKTLEMISELICGDKLADKLFKDNYNDCPCYRKGSDLPKFFNNAGLECREFTNETRKWYVLDQLENYNLDSSIEKVILRLAHPKEYYNNKIHEEVLKQLNVYLALEGFEVIIDGIEPRLKISDSYIPINKTTKTCVIDYINFNKIVCDEKLCNILELRWNEIESCLSAEAFLAAIILMGSILEGVLIHNVEKNPKDANQSPYAPKYKNNTIKKFKHWTLNDLINVAHDLDWMGKDIKDFNSSLRDYRNLVHPIKQREDMVYPDQDTCNICIQVVYAALNDLEKSFNSSKI